MFISNGLWVGRLGSVNEIAPRWRYIQAILRSVHLPSYILGGCELKRKKACGHTWIHTLCLPSDLHNGVVRRHPWSSGDTFLMTISAFARCMRLSSTLQSLTISTTSPSHQWFSPRNTSGPQCPSLCPSPKIVSPFQSSVLRLETDISWSCPHLP